MRINWKLAALAGLPLLFAGLVVTASPAQQIQAGAAQTPNQKIVLVTPEGELLGYVPDINDVVVKIDRHGRRALIDHFGNLVATEMSAQQYQAMVQQNDGGANVNTDTGADPVQQDLANNNGTDFFPAAPRRDVNTGDNLTTGTVQGQDNTATDGFQDQSLPGDGVKSDNANQDLASIEPQSDIRNATPVEPDIILTGNKTRAEITALQVFLDRSGASPGAIDGKMGSNVSKAIRAYDKISGETLDPNNIEDILTRLGTEGGLPIMNYTISSADAAGPYVAAIPEDYSQKAALPSMAYTSVTEALAERFHMDEAYLKELNPGVDFTIPGTTVKVVNPGLPKQGKVAKIIADKARKQVFAYDATGALIAAYPASIGSTDTPSPSGIHTVVRVAFDPNYTYNPKINFRQGANTKVLTVPPGPNGPVGTVWIALSKPTYGIHGTPEPSKIGRTQSHGCIRLTNWDATELAKMVSPGVTVEFID